MSDELADEVEAINSIYGDGTLVAADEPAAFILNLPGGASSLRLRFPSTYPASAPPEVLGTHHSSGGRRGAGAADLALFRDVIGQVFQDGVVCLFDAVEEFTRRCEDEATAEAEEVAAAAAAAAADDAGAFEDDGDYGTRTAPAPTLEPDLPEPEWTLSDVFVENKSTFIAHVARVTSPSLARHYVHHLLASSRRIRSATHNMTAWRIRGPGGASFQDCDDDGEAAAGGRLLHLMQLMDLWDAMVVVTRWYGGVKLGPRRFAVINATARDGFVRAGLVEDDGGKDKEKKKGK